MISRPAVSLSSRPCGYSINTNHVLRVFSDRYGDGLIDMEAVGGLSPGSRRYLSPQSPPQPGIHDSESPRARGGEITCVLTLVYRFPTSTNLSTCRRYWKPNWSYSAVSGDGRSWRYVVTSHIVLTISPPPTHPENAGTTSHWILHETSEISIILSWSRPQTVSILDHSRRSS